MELAMDGDRSQPDLVKGEIAKRIRRFWGFVNRGLQRYAGLKTNNDRITDAQLHIAAKTLARKLAKKGERRDRRHFEDVFKVLAYIFVDDVQSAQRPNSRMHT